MILSSVTRGRSGWIADVQLQGDRAVGTLYHSGKVARAQFNVAVKNGEFLVDIGTGSGVKIKFRM